MRPHSTEMQRKSIQIHSQGSQMRCQSTQIQRQSTQKTLVFEVFEFHLRAVSG